MARKNQFDVQTVLDGLGQGVLIFNSDKQLILDNLAARSLLGADLNVIRSEGWSAVTVLFNTGVNNPDEQIDAIREKALQSERPIRFRIYRSGEYVPCWGAAITGTDGNMYFMVTLDQPDWYAVTEMVDRFRSEMTEAIDSTRGHIDLIEATITRHQASDTAEQLGKRVKNFSRLISIHMERTARLMEMLERLEHIRTGKVRDTLRQQQRKLDIADFLEDFVEELDEIQLLDPETEKQNIRSRVKVDTPDGVYAFASASYLRRILQDMLRNAIMYSLKATPIKITVEAKQHGIQINMQDEGYGIRDSEYDRVFAPFSRARQPQIIGEFGYGLSLYLCKHEVEAMNGRMWFDSRENVGTTFSIMLPLWRDSNSTSSSSTTSKA